MIVGSMGKKLAIKGHPTRGKEVIELLEMMGGINKNMLSAHIGDVLNPHVYFFDSDSSDNRIVWYYLLGLEWDGRASEMMIFTLEEFLEKYPYKVGDKVNSPCKGCIKTITSMEWDTYLNTVTYKLDNRIYTNIDQLKVVNDLPYKETDDMKLSDSKCERTHEDMIFDSIIWHLRNSVNNGKQNLSGGECEDYFREVVKKNNENKMKNVIAELLEHIKTTPKEDLEREFEEIKEWSNVRPTVEEFMSFCECVNKKPFYPKTYEECFNIYTNHNASCLLVNITDSLYNLLICRNAYWKIAGEQMGLDKPWEPQFENCSIPHYCIFINHRGEVCKDCFYGSRCLLAFPTAEMRDAFFESFKDVIENCKELL